MNDTIKCPLCQENKSPDCFYKSTRRKKSFVYGYCKPCFNAYNDTRRRKLKEQAILYKGSKCVRCQRQFPDEPAFVFDFHHTNPSKKGEWNSIRKLSWERIKTEIDKCILVCAICHRYIEYDPTERMKYTCS